MKKKPWQLDRREFLRGSGGFALGLPFLEAMDWRGALARGAGGIGAAAGLDARAASERGCLERGRLPSDELPKRLVTCYISYGVYEPKTKDGSHHDWSWWPCKDAGPLSFNKSAAPFAPLSDYVSYLRGLDHAGGYALGGHSSGDVFATGADMAGAEKTNNISLDQVAAKVHGHETRYPSLVLGTEGGTGSYGMCKTLSHYGPGRPIPSLHKPQIIFDKLFRPYAGKSIAEVRAELARDASVLDLMLEQSKSLKRRLGKSDQHKLDEYLESIRALELRVARTTKWLDEPLPEVDASKLELEASYKNPVEYTRCMYDLLYLALQTDSTRYASFMLESEQSTQNEVGKFATYALGYEGQTHDIAHKRPIESGHWDRWRAAQHAYFLREALREPFEAIDGAPGRRAVGVLAKGRPIDVVLRGTVVHEATPDEALGVEDLVQSTPVGVFALDLLEEAKGPDVGECAVLEAVACPMRVALRAVFLDAPVIVRAVHHAAEVERMPAVGGEQHVAVVIEDRGLLVEQVSSRVAAGALGPPLKFGERLPGAKVLREPMSIQRHRLRPGCEGVFVRPARRVDAVASVSQRRMLLRRVGDGPRLGAAERVVVR